MTTEIKSDARGFYFVLNGKASGRRYRERTTAEAHAGHAQARVEAKQAAAFVYDPAAMFPFASRHRLTD